MGMGTTTMPEKTPPNQALAEVRAQDAITVLLGKRIFRGVYPAEVEQKGGQKTRHFSAESGHIKLSQCGQMTENQVHVSWLREGRLLTRWNGGTAKISCDYTKIWLRVVCKAPALHLVAVPLLKHVRTLMKVQLWLDLRWT